jgi:hypothetical protein
MRALICISDWSHNHAAFGPNHHRAPVQRVFGTGAVLLDQCTLDLERVLQWIKSCDTMHGVCRCPFSPSDASFSSQDIYLVSTSRRCLVKAKAREKYLAFSYVWGAKLPNFTTTKSTLKLLQEDGSLSSASIQDEVPGTVQRVMHFVLLLGCGVFMDRHSVYRARRPSPRRFTDQQHGKNLLKFLPHSVCG